MFKTILHRLHSHTHTHLKQGSLSLSDFSVSIIYHHLFICLCLFTSIVSFHHRHASQPLSQTPSCTLMHLCNVLLSVTPHIRSQYVHIYLCCQRLPSLSLCLSGAIYQDGPSLCLSVCLFLPACQVSQETPVLLIDAALSWTELWQRSSDRNFREPVWRKTVRGN